MHTQTKKIWLTILSLALVFAIGGSVYSIVKSITWDGSFGKSLVIEPAFKRSKYSLSEDDVAFVSSTGRDVICEWLGLSFQVMAPQPLLGAHYFYYADSTIPKIKSIQKIGNDWPSVLFFVDQLEKNGTEYERQNLGQTIDVPAMVLSTIRRDSLYGYSASWHALAGSSDRNFSSFVSRKSEKTGLTAEDFFAYYNRDGQKSDFPAKKRHDYLLKDHQNATIDYHLMKCLASANCFYYGSKDPTTKKWEKLLDSYLSWGDKLQKACAYEYLSHQGSPLTPDFSFVEVLDDPNSYFSWSELYADVDGTNMAYQGLKEGKSVVDSLSLLFSYREEERFQHFLHQGAYAESGEDSLPEIGKKIMGLTDWDYQSIDLFGSSNSTYTHGFDMVSLTTPFDSLMVRGPDGSLRLPPAEFRSSFLFSFFSFLKEKASE